MWNNLVDQKVNLPIDCFWLNELLEEETNN